VGRLTTLCLLLCQHHQCCLVVCPAVPPRFLGLTVGTVQSNTGIEAAQAAYGCHITYVTGQELCFNYLKDNTAQSAAELVRGILQHRSAQGWL